MGDVYLQKVVIDKAAPERQEIQDQGNQFVSANSASAEKSRPSRSPRQATGGQEDIRVFWTTRPVSEILRAMTAREAIDPILDRIRDMDVIRVIVFGSAATGHVRSDSDLDLAIIVADPENPLDFNRTETALEVRRRIRDINAQLALDILVYTESEFARLSEIPSTVRSELIEGGETVYERAR